MNVNLIGDGNARRPRPAKSRDEILLDRLHSIRIAAAAVWKRAGGLELRDLGRALEDFDRADVQTRTRQT